MPEFDGKYSKYGIRQNVVSCLFQRVKGGNLDAPHATCHLLPGEWQVPPLQAIDVGHSSYPSPEFARRIPAWISNWTRTRLFENRGLESIDAARSILRDRSGSRPFCFFISKMSTGQGLRSLAKASTLLTSTQPANSIICRQCQRSFATTPAQWAGHNKWSKTKHIKAVTDKKKMTERAGFTKTIAMYSRSKPSVYRLIVVDVLIEEQCTVMISSLTLNWPVPYLLRQKVNPKTLPQPFWGSKTIGSEYSEKLDRGRHRARSRPFSHWSPARIHVPRSLDAPHHCHDH